MNPQKYYWDTFTDIKHHQVYLNMYEQRLDSIERYINVVSAVASSTAIGGWVLWQHIQFIWAFVIALSQVITATKPFLPFGQRLKALNGLTPEIEALALTAETDWFKVSRSILTEEEILALATTLKSREKDATQKHFKGLVLPEQATLKDKADKATIAYMKSFQED